MAEAAFGEQLEQSFDNHVSQSSGNHVSLSFGDQVRPSFGEQVRQSFGEQARQSFGEQLRQSRRAAALSLRQLAARVGYDHSYLSQVERGQRHGSAQLARLCDQELHTAGRLASAYQVDAHSKQSSPTTPATPTPTTASPTSALAPSQLAPGRLARGHTGPARGGEWLEAVRLGLYGAGEVERADEWQAVAAGYVRDFPTVPPGELVPELAAELQLLSREPTVHHVQVSELGILLAQALTELGEPRAAARWWRTSRLAAEASGLDWLQRIVHGREAASGLVAGRPLAELLRLAEEGTAGDHQLPGLVARALAAKAEILGRLGRAEEAHQALRDLLATIDKLPAATTPSSPHADSAPHEQAHISPSEHADSPPHSDVGSPPCEYVDNPPDKGVSALARCRQYERHGLEGRVCAVLKYGLAGCVLLQQALSVCSAENVGDRARLELSLAECLVLEREVAAGLAMALRVLVELPDPWHTQSIYQAAERVEAAVPGSEVGRAEARDLRILIARRPGRGAQLLERSSSGTRLAG